MHRTQVLLEDVQYIKLKARSEETGRSIGDLVREAVDAQYGISSERQVRALRSSWAAWADREDIGNGAEYVEQIRQPFDEEPQEPGWG